MEEAADVEHTLSILPTAHVYKLPPRPSAGGWQCQQWPKENHIFSGKVIIVAQGSKCTIRLVDSESGSLFAQCPLDNDNPTLSVEPVIDSSRYFVVRVADGSGRYAFLGMGFVERSDAFEFNQADASDAALSHLLAGALSSLNSRTSFGHRVNMFSSSLLNLLRQSTAPTAGWPPKAGNSTRSTITAST